MKLTPQSTDNDSNGRETMLLVESYYTIEKAGWGQNSMPIIHLCGRNANMQRRHIRIFGFRPRFFISEQEFVQKRDYIEREMESRSGSILDYGQGHKLMDELNTISGVMIVCETPNCVGSDGVNENFDRTWEADVDYCDVFNHENGIQQYLSVPNGVSEVHHSKVNSEDHTDIEINERVCTFDIEVMSEDGFPDNENPDQPITAITAHDSYTDEYWSGVLRPRCQDKQHPDTPSDSSNRNDPEEGWDKSVENHLRQGQYTDQLTFYDDDKALCYDFIQYLLSSKPDILSGWNSQGFDIPYLINRCLKLKVSGVKDLSPTKDVDWIHDGRSVNHRLKGVVSLDALDGYKAVTIGQEKSYKLDDIAEKILGYGKEDVEGSEIDDTWREQPELFLEYSIRDVEAVVEIMDEKDILTDLRGRRELTGTAIEETNYPHKLIDPAVIQHGYDYLEVE